MSNLVLQAPVAFDYAVLDKDLATECRATAGRIKGRFRTTTFEIGRDLIAIKDKMPHGTFGSWIAAEFGFSDRTGQNYMNAARFMEGKSETVSLLPSTVLYALAAPTASPVSLRTRSDADAELMSAVKILDWKPRSSGALRGFADIEFPSGLRFHECGIFEQNGKWWAAPASKPPQISRDGTVLKDDCGKTKYVPVVSFSDKARRDLWSNAVVAALHAQRPEVPAG